MKYWRPFLAAFIMVSGVLMPVHAAADSAWFWHYTPSSLRGTQALGVSTSPTPEQGALQARLHLGYELESYGVAVLWQHPLLSAHPTWGLDTGLTLLLDTREEVALDSVTAHARWRWLKTWGDFRLDAGYGVQGQWADEGLGLNPSFDATLGWRL